MKYIDKEKVEKVLLKLKNNITIKKEKNFFYNGFQNTLSDKFFYVLNDEEKTEYAKCFNDAVYFIETYLGIKLRPYQKQWIRLYEKDKHIIYNTARESGYNTILSAINLHDMIFNEKSILLFFYKKEQGEKFFNMISEYIINLPYFLKPQIVDYTPNRLKFKKSSISIYNEHLNNVYNHDVFQYIDFAHFTSSDVDKTYIQNIAFVASGNNNKCIIQSSNNDGSFFNELFEKSTLVSNHPEKTIFNTMKTYWWEVEGRDEIWKQNKIDEIGIDKFNSDYELK